ncbi:SpoIIIAC/SpoIIIAD family protein [Faecalicatena contorta]|uniref:SpoIIIAC/SpoIIIAD family protein n=1 Tax=Faecalicatena contorta TaxID=39482 RepID=UPI001F41B5E5|nr:SpoIIIAC/SpoIIIAD family protein [Faecalicatena contorta]MCF2553704.1 stage III sporulation protein AD [Faecalicatena contorta]MCF2681080.1 stage III sporulation protein AD [Faecalicatena contorta]
MDMVQIGVLGVAGALLAIQFKSGKAEYGIYISIALSLIIFFSVLGQLQTIIDALKTVGEYIRVDHLYIGTLVKMLGVTYIAEFSSGICKDAGYQTIALQIEIFGKLAVLILSMPVLMGLLDTVREFLS